ncbi:MAG: gliding motility-associated C-terminal domain-containing protein [Flavobacteriales bacterium]|nr:gliding motility-associated C-terminal domain-containing protein [Flavobacteriales bacterium]
MLKPLLRFAVATLLIASASEARASHYLGGNITWECQGGNNYLVTVDLFFDCTSGAVGFPQLLHVASACASFDTLLLPPPLVEVSQVCAAELPNTVCNGGGLMGVWQGSYQVLLNLPPCAGGWRMWWAICCRPPTVDLVGAPGIYLEGLLRNDLAPCNSSPTFSQNVVPNVCIGQPVYANFGAVDPESDSLVYSLIGARGFANSSAAIGYQTGHTALQPVVGATIDPVTGQLQFTPTTIGFLVFVVAVTQYDAAGNYIGTVMRDMAFVCMPCSGSAPQPNDATLNGPGGPGTNALPGSLLSSPNTIEVCNGVPVCFSLVFNDPDAGTVLSVQTQAATLLPGSTVNITGTNPLIITVCWTGNVANSPVNVVFQVNDGACPVENITGVAVNITSVLPPISVDAGTDSVISVCTGTVAFSLLSQLGGTPQANGHWKAPGGVDHTDQFDPATDPPGVYTYRVGNACVNATSTVTISVVPQPMAGTNGTLTLCSNSASVALSTGLGGSPDAGGSWALQGGGAVADTYDPATQASGIYVYTVTGGIGCVSAAANVTVTENAVPNAGTDASTAICANGAPVNLFSVLGGTPTAGGTWSGGLVGGMYDPAVNAPGSFVYTVSGTAPCANATATVTVTEPAPPNAGNNATLSICANGAPVDLFPILGGTPALGGSWSGGLIGGMYDPAVNSPGSFVYTIIGTAPCANATATVTVAQTTAPDPGVDAVLNTCANGTPVALISALGGTPDVGGTWSGPSGAITGQYDPATMDPGIYTYTIAATGSCAAVQSEVTVNSSAAPNAGTDAVLSLCSVNSTTNLYFLLTGAEFGGSWTGPNGFFDGTYEPGTDPAGTYTYTVSGVAPCQDDQATVIVNETQAPVAGRDTTVILCSNGSPENLFPLLPNAQAGGTWLSGFSGTYSPGSTSPGTFVYSVPGTPPCLADQASITIVESTPPNAGTDASIILCDQGSAVNIFTTLDTADAGGSWSGPSTVVSNMYDPATMLGGAYVYTVVGTAPCANTSATITVTETGSPDAGSDGTVSLCSNGALTDLFAQLGGNPDAGGSWSSGIIGGILDPSSLSAGTHTFTYTLAATAPCTSDAANVVVTISAPPSAGADASISVCDQGSAVNIFTALGAADSGGTWSGPSTVVGNMYDPATMNGGAYMYTVVGTAPCANTSATITVTETGSPDAGSDGTVSLCSNGALTDLFAQLGGSPDAGGSWSGPSAIAGGVFDPASDLEGAYTYSISGTAPCLGASSQVVVSVEILPYAGGDGVDSVCTGETPFDLSTVLQGSPQPGGTWTLGSTIVPSTFDPGSSSAGTYTYTVQGNVCPAATSTVTIDVAPGPNAGQDNAIALCSTGPVVNLLGLLSGTPDAGGTWAGPDGSSANGTLDPSASPAGAYTYTVAGNANCTAASATIVVSISQAASAGGNGALTLCSSQAPYLLISALTGSPDQGGSWTGPSPVNANGTLTPSNSGSGDYIYTVTPALPCPVASAQVAVVITQAPNAGLDADATLCNTFPALPLINLLGGTPDLNGIWTDPNGQISNGSFAPGMSVPGQYTYDAPAIANCPTETSIVDISVATAAFAGLDGDTIVCANGAAFALEGLLQGPYDTGGQWSGPAGPLSNDSFHPAYDPAGTYLYTVSSPHPCLQDIAQVVVQVLAVPSADPTFTMGSGCVPTEVTFNSGYTGEGNCAWDLGNGSTSDSCGTVTVTYTVPGQYFVTFTADPGNGCTVEHPLGTAIVVANEPVAAFNMVRDHIGTLDPVAAFSNQSSGATTYAWDFGGLGTSELFSPQFSFPYGVEDIYTVCLTAFATPTCSDTVCADLLVPANAFTFVPNAFSPDGDGHNDLFMPINTAVDRNDYNFIVVDRWGHLAFITEDPDAGWDGNLPNGTAAAIGVYVWKLYGTEAISATKFERIGHVTLLR